MQKYIDIKKNIQTGAEIQINRKNTDRLAQRNRKAQAYRQIHRYRHRKHKDRQTTRDPDTENTKTDR